MDLRTLQLNLPWTIKYSRDFRANPQPHRDFAHALIHTGKALGKLFAFADDMDHDRDVALQVSPTSSARYLADLVICAMRASNTYPGTVIDLEAAVIERLESKNGTKLAIAPAEDPLGIKASAQHRQRAYREDRREWSPEDAKPQINIHTPAEERVRMLAARIDALEKQLDDERATLASVEAKLGAESIDLIHAKGDAERHLATIWRMQPLCDAAQRSATRFEVLARFEDDARSDEQVSADRAARLEAYRDVIEAADAYQKASSIAADADMPF